MSAIPTLPHCPGPVSSPIVSGTLEYQSALGSCGDRAAWTDGKALIVRDRGILPARCVKCNCGEGVTMRVHHYRWAPPATYLLLFLGLVPGAFVIELLSSTAKAKMGLCRRCGTRRMVHLGIAWGSFVMSIVCLVGGLVLTNPYLLLPMVVLLLAAPVYGAIMGKVCTVRRIEGGVMWLSGAGKVFLTTLDAGQEANGRAAGAGDAAKN